MIELAAETEQDIVKLPEATEGNVIEYFSYFMKNKSVAPGNDGKKTFFQQAVRRRDFLPEFIQVQIDKNRNGLPQAEYLKSHTEFHSTFCGYFG